MLVTNFLFMLTSSDMSWVISLELFMSKKENTSLPIYD